MMQKQMILKLVFISFLLIFVSEVRADAIDPPMGSSFPDIFQNPNMVFLMTPSFMPPVGGWRANPPQSMGKNYSQPFNHTGAWSVYEFVQSAYSFPVTTPCPPNSFCYSFNQNWNVTFNSPAWSIYFDLDTTAENLVEAIENGNGDMFKFTQLTSEGGFVDPRGVYTGQIETVDGIEDATISLDIFTLAADGWTLIPWDIELGSISPLTFPFLPYVLGNWGKVINVVAGGGSQGELFNPAFYGDLNDDGITNQMDLDLALSITIDQFTVGGGAQALPEPSSILVMSFIGLIITRRTRC